MKFGDRKHVESRESNSQDTAGGNQLELKKKGLLHIGDRDKEIHCCNLGVLLLEIYPSGDFANRKPSKMKVGVDQSQNKEENSIIQGT